MRITFLDTWNILTAEAHTFMIDNFSKSLIQRLYAIIMDGLFLAGVLHFIVQILQLPIHFPNESI